MTARPLRYDPDRVFPADPSTRPVARTLFAARLWFADNQAWRDATSLLRAPDLDQPLPAAIAA